MSQVYHTTSLVTKSSVELLERTTHSGLRYLIKKNGLPVAECEYMCDAYKLYNDAARD